MKVSVFGSCSKYGSLQAKSELENIAHERGMLDADIPKKRRVDKSEGRAFREIHEGSTNQTSDCASLGIREVPLEELRVSGFGLQSP